MGVSLKTENEDWSGEDHADKGQRPSSAVALLRRMERRAARFTRLWRRRRRPGFHRHLHAGFKMAGSPAALRPPHPWPKAGHCAVASSLFCF